MGAPSPQEMHTVKAAAKVSIGAGICTKPDGTFVQNARRILLLKLNFAAHHNNFSRHGAVMIRIALPTLTWAISPRRMAW